MLIPTWISFWYTYVFIYVGHLFWAVGYLHVQFYIHSQSFKSSFLPEMDMEQQTGSK